MNPTTTCPGSLQEPRYPDVRGGFVKCRYCPSLVPARVVLDADGFRMPTADIVPSHRSPVTDRDIRIAADVLWAEYRRARENGTLHRPPKGRWHAYALDMVLPAHTFAPPA